MTYPAASTPMPSIHQDPPETLNKPPFTGPEIQAIGEAITEGILAQVALALGNVTVLGVKPFAFLTTWGNTLETDATNALTGANTASTLATTLRTDFNSLLTNLFGSTTIGTILQSGTIPNITKAMSSDLQGVIDNIYQAVNGGSSTGNTLASVKTNLQGVFTNLFGSSTLGTVLQYSALPNISIGGATATDIKSQIQALTDNVHQAIQGGSTTGNTLATLKTDMQSFVQNLFGTGNPVGTKIQYSAVPNISIGGSATDIQSTVQSLVDGVHQAVQGGSGTGNLVSDVKAQLTNVYTNLFGSGNAPSSSPVQYATLPTITVGSTVTDIQSHVQTVSSGLAQIPNINVLIPQNPGSGITYDAGAHGTPVSGSGSNPSLSWSHTVGSTANYLIVRTFSPVASSLNYGLVTCGGFGMRLLASYVNVQIWGIANPPTGPQSIVVPFTGSGAYVIQGSSDSYIGVVAAGSASSNFATSSGSMSQSISSATGNVVVQVFGVDSSSSETLSSYSGTSRYNSGSTSYSGGYAAMLAGDASGSSTVSFTATASPTPGYWYSTAVNLVPIPAAQLGSGFRYYKVGTSTTTVSTGNNLLPNTFFDSAGTATVGSSYNSSDYTYYLATNNKLVVSYAGWYVVTVALLGTTIGTSSGAYYALLYQNGTLVQQGPGALQIGGSWAHTFGATFIVYCNAGDYLQPGYNASAAGINLTGESTGTQCYWEVSLLNRSLA